MADPDYDMGSEEIDKQAEELGVTASKLRGGVSRDAGDLHFVRLPETRTEVDEIERVVMNRYLYR
jgi:hypothetical protein